MNHYKMNHLKQLESEAIYVMREVAAQFERPVMLFSGGKDSICMAYLAMKAFYPGKIPFPLMHIDTGHNFPETLEFRDNLMKETETKLIVRYVQDTVDQGKAVDESGPDASRNKIQTITLLDGLEDLKVDAAMGGGRRDEEKARAKERFFSHRDDFGQWDPKNQRPELWNLFNGRKNMGEHFRVFPISNWTEMDVWQYILLENIEIPNIYFTHKRRVFNRNGVWLAEASFMKTRDSEEVVEKEVRCRTIGDITNTGLTESKARTLEEIVQEVAATRTTERGARADDKRSEAAMEDRKKDGYF